jgi:uncharacterized lipoprotein YddW (UPF0748 family)
MIFAIAACAQPVPGPAGTAGFTVRAAWHVPVEKNEAAVEATVRRAAAAGLNRLYVAAISDGHTFYKSELYPCLKDYESFDVVDAFIRQGKACGLSIHAWAQVFCAGFSTSPLVREHPDWLARDERMGAASLFEQVRGNAYHFLCPGNAEACAFVQSGLDELIRKGADGIELDSICYPISRTTAADRQTFCFRMRDIGGCGDADRRENNIIQFIARLRQRHPDERISAAVCPDLALARGERSQNWAAFPVDSIDFKSFVIDTNRIAAWVRQATPRQSVLVGVAPALDMTPDKLAEQVRAARDAGANGVIFYALDWLDDAMREKLRKEVWPESARMR